VPREECREIFPFSLTMFTKDGPTVGNMPQQIAAGESL
jgi:hypothetical protein